MLIIIKFIKKKQVGKSLKNLRTNNNNCNHLLRMTYQNGEVSVKIRSPLSLRRNSQMKKLLLLYKKYVLNTYIKKKMKSLLIKRLN